MVMNTMEPAEGLTKDKASLMLQFAHEFKRMTTWVKKKSTTQQQQQQQQLMIHHDLAISK
jgi:hypothetical protein